MKKIKFAIGAGLLALALSACTSQNTATTSRAETEQAQSSPAVSAEASQDLEGAVVIALSEESITVDGEPIGNDQGSPVYLQDVTETHPDATAGIVNRVVTITQPGAYSFSGELANGQIRVDIDPSQQEETIIQLNGVTIENQTAPGILVKSAYDPQEAGKSSVTIRSAAGTENTVNASHIAEYTDENGVEQDYDGAVSADVSITLDGTGTLNVQGDKEGIETKLHLTIEDGDYNIYASDDSLNASEDNVSVITINGGHILANSTGGEEGDGIDSNGSIVINGGEVVAVANENSMDSGLDSDLGITINGGRVVAAGNMYDEVLDTGAQMHMTLAFSEAPPAGSPVVLLDENDQVVFAYTPSTTSSIMVISLPELAEGQTYSVYTGGTVTGTENDGLYSQVDSYEKGSEMQHGGEMTGFGGRQGGAPPEGFGGENGPQGERPEMPEGFDPADMQEGEMPETPEGVDPSDVDPSGIDPSGIDPSGGQGRGPGGQRNQGQQTEVSTDFSLTVESRYFYNVSSVG